MRTDSSSERAADSGRGRNQPLKWGKVRDNKDVLGGLIKEVLSVAEQAVEIREKQMLKIVNKSRGKV